MTVPHLFSDCGHRGVARLNHPRHLVDAHAGRQSLAHGLLPFGIEPGPAEGLTLRTYPFEPGSRPLTDANTLLLRERGHHRQHNIPHHLVVCREQRLCIAVKTYTVVCEPLEVADGWPHALAAEAVQRPAQHKIELALMGV